MNLAFLRAVQKTDYIPVSVVSARSPNKSKRYTTLEQQYAVGLVLSGLSRNEVMAECGIGRSAIAKYYNEYREDARWNHA